MQSTFMTPLMCAAINGHMTTAQNLMERGCDPNLSDCNDKTALQLAQERGKREVIGFLDRKTSNKLSVGKCSALLFMSEFGRIFNLQLVKHVESV